MKKPERYWLDGPIGPGRWWGVGDAMKGGIEWHFDTKREAQAHLEKLRAAEARDREATK